MRIPDEVRDCVVFLGIPETHPDGQETVTFQGTAFFVSVPSDHGGLHYFYLVTAKHVAEKLHQRRFCARLNTHEGGSALASGTGGERWWYHPDDDSVDVALLAWSPPRDQFDFKVLPVNMFVSEQTMKAEDIGLGSEVFITGLFSRMSGRARNLPIVRIGNIAMMPGEPVPTKWGPGHVEAYLIEARSTGRVSGSPVFVQGRIVIDVPSRYYLLGLMHGHWDIPDARQLVDGVTQDFRDVDGPVNMGIAIVVPSQKIYEALNQPALVQDRARQDREFMESQAATPDTL